MQFVPFLQFKGNSLELARQTLKELPKQLVEYMAKQGIVPPNKDLHPLAAEDRKAPPEDQMQPGAGVGAAQAPAEDDYFRSEGTRFKEQLSGAGFTDIQVLEYMIKRV